MIDKRDIGFFHPPKVSKLVLGTLEVFRMKMMHRDSISARHACHNPPVCAPF